MTEEAGQQNDESRSIEQAWEDLLEFINRQLEINTRLKEILEPLTGAPSQAEGIALTEEKTSEVKDLFIELEALQAKERPIYHSLFGTEE